jgi:hypothetical protein
MAEWLKAHAWKACKGAILSWVRIPFSPPLNKPYVYKVQIYLFIKLLKKYNSAIFLKNGIINLFQILKYVS